MPEDEYAGTEASGGVDIAGIGKGNLNIKTQNRCPPGYYWVKTYKKHGFFGSTTVQGHCREAGSYEREQQQARRDNLRDRERRRRAKAERKRKRMRRRARH